MRKYLENVEETPVEVDPDIKIQGLKNPIYLVIIGFSTRGVLDSCRKAGKEIQNTLIIEPSAGVFKQTLRREYVADILNDETVDLITDVKPDELMIHVQKTFAKMDVKGGPRPSKCAEPEIIIDPFVYKSTETGNDPVAEQIVRIVQEASKQVFLSMGCSADTTWRWQQTMRNEENLKESYLISELYGQFKGIPIVVLGAGPSLEDFIREAKINKLHEKSLVIACDAALARLLKEDIKPHIVTRCERKLTTIFNKVRKEDLDDVFYASYSWCPPEYFKLFAPNNFMLFRENGVNNWTEYRHGAVNGGVSSANAAVELAYLFEPSCIVISGIDLCFMDNKSHVEGTEVEFDIEKSKPKWTEVKSNNGEMVTTIPVWKRCLNEYVGTIFKHQKKNIPIYNTSVNGAKIEGAELVTWGLVIDKMPADVSALATIKSKLKKPDLEREVHLLAKKEESVKFLEKARYEFEKLFLFVEDAMIGSKREEMKCISQLKASTDPVEFFNSVEQVKKSLAELYKEPCRQIDKVRNKYLVDKTFSELILDTCQLDLFQTENKVFSLKNKVPSEHERMKAYIALYITLFRLFDFCAERMITLFKSGPEDVHFDFEKEVMELD